MGDLELDDGLGFAEERPAFVAAYQHLHRTRHQIIAGIKETGEQRELRIEAASEALTYQTSHIMSLSESALAELDLDHLGAMLKWKYKNEVKDKVDSNKQRRAREEKYVRLYTNLFDYRGPSQRRSCSQGDPGRVERVERWHDSVLLLATVRLLSLMGRRTNRPRLDDAQLTVYRFYLEREIDVPALAKGDVKLLCLFPEDATQWKKNLAVAIKKSPAFITETIAGKILPAARTAIYLFVMLAPSGHAVLRQSEMDSLLDLVYRANRQIETSLRRLLQYAPECLVDDEGEFLIDIDTLAANPSAGGPLDPEHVFHKLHESEARYAVNVEAQTDDPPRFRCVAGCDQHRPLGEN